EVVGPVLDEHVELLERVAVHQEFHALARGEFPTLVLRLDAGLAAAAAGAGAARFKLFDNVLHGPSKLQHTTRKLTVGALGNDMAPPGVPGLAAASSAASLTSKRKTSSSPVCPLRSCPPTLSFMSQILLLVKIIVCAS